MNRYYFTVFIVISLNIFVYAQPDEIWLDTAFENEDTATIDRLLTPSETEEYISALDRSEGEFVLGGYVSSIFREPADSVKVLISIDGIWSDTTYTKDGLFSSVLDRKGDLIDLFISHPDYHVLDTSFIITGK